MNRLNLYRKLVGDEKSKTTNHNKNILEKRKKTDEIAKSIVMNAFKEGCGSRFKKTLNFTDCAILINDMVASTSLPQLVKRMRSSLIRVFGLASADFLFMEKEAVAIYKE